MRRNMRPLFTTQHKYITRTETMMLDQQHSALSVLFFSSRLRWHSAGFLLSLFFRRACGGRFTRGGEAQKGAPTAQDEMPAQFYDAVAEPSLLDSQIEMPEELKRNLQQVLQTLEAQVYERRHDYRR
jgi:hypothetical protein